MVVLGEVNYRGELTVVVEIRDKSGELHQFPALIDTGFTGYLTLPQVVIDALSLDLEGERDVLLGDGSESKLSQYVVIIRWFDKDEEINALEAEGLPLIGLRLLQGCYLTHHGVDGGAVMLYHP